MSTVSIRESGIPRLYRTVWLRSNVGPDSGTLARRIASASFAGLGDDAPAGESVGYLEAWILLRATGDLTKPFQRDLYWWNADIVNAFNRWAERQAFGAVNLEPDVELSDPEAPNPDFMIVSPSEVFYALLDAALAPANDSRLRAALAEAEIEPVEFLDALRARRPEKPEPEPPVVVARKPIWPGLLALGIIGGGIWSLWKGHS